MLLVAAVRGTIRAIYNKTTLRRKTAAFDKIPIRPRKRWQNAVLVHGNRVK
jgi:hypothetical protein